MKCIKKILVGLVAILAINCSFAEEMSIDEISRQARVTHVPVDVTDVDLSKLSEGDISANYLQIICSPCVMLPVVKLYAEYKGYHPDTHKESGSPLGAVVESWTPILLSFLATFILLIILFAIFLKMRGDNKNFILKFTMITLISSLVLQPVILFQIVGGISLTAFSAWNYGSRTVDVRMYSSNKAKDLNKGAYIEQTTLNYYDNTDGNLIANAIVEDTTKSTLLHTHGDEIGKDGWFNTKSDITVGQVLDIIQNQISVKPVAQYKDGVPDSVSFVWNENFEEYTAKRFGAANILFPIEVMVSDSQIESLDNSYIKDVKKQADADGQKVFTSGGFYNELNRLEGVAYELISAGEAKKAESYYDANIADAVATAMKAGLKTIYERYKSEGLSANELTSIYRAYGTQFIKSANGINTNLTIIGKWKYAQKAQAYFKIYNGSENFEKSVNNRKLIDTFNSLGAGNSWADSWRIFGSINWQFVTISGGKAVFTGVDDTDTVKMEMFKNKASASFVAMNLLKSNIIQGADNGQRAFSGELNPYASMIQGNWDMGALAAVALNTDALGKLLNGSALLNSSFRNAYNVTRYVDENSVGVDMVKILGEGITKDALLDARYTYITDNYKRLIFDQIASAKQAVNVKSHQQAKTSTGGSSIGDTFISFMQNRSSILTNFKEDTGLPHNMSITEGLRYCNVNKAECDAKSTGTVSGLYRPDFLEFGIFTEMTAVLIKALDSIDLDLKGTSFSAVKSLIDKIPFVGVIMGAISGLIKLLAVFAVLLDLIGNAFILIGGWGILLKVMPMIQALLTQSMVPIMVLETTLLLIFYTLFSIIKLNPMLFLRGMKSIASIWLGVGFWFMGYYVMLGMIYYVNIGPLQRGLYSTVASDGGITSMIEGMIVVYVATALLHTTYLLIPKMFMTMKSKLFGDDNSTSYSEVTDSKQFETLGITYLAERGLISGADKLIEHAKGPAKSLLDRGKDKYFPNSRNHDGGLPTKPTSVTEGIS